MKRPLALFVGNRILRDDRIGLVLGERLRERLESQGFEVELFEGGGLAYVDYFQDRPAVVIIDSVKAPKCRIGTLLKLSPEEFKAVKGVSPHYTGLPEALMLMRELGIRPPKRLIIFGVVVKDIETPSTKMSPELEKLVDQLAEELLAKIEAQLKPVSNPAH